MDLIKRFEPLYLLLLVLVAVNWAIVVVFDTNVVREVMGTGTVRDVFYVVAGLGALTFIPRLMDELHLGGHGARPHRV